MPKEVLKSPAIDRDRAIGHSHFLIPRGESQPLPILRNRLRYDIIPLVEEYCYADRSMIQKVFGGLVNDGGEIVLAILNDDVKLLAAVKAITDGGTTGQAPGLN